MSAGIILISELKKGNTFKFNDITYTVRQKFADWRRNDEPYLKTECGQIFWSGDLKVKSINLW